MHFLDTIELAASKGPELLVGNDVTQPDTT